MSYAATLPAPAIAAHGDFVASDLAASAGATASPELRTAADFSFSAPASTAAQAVESVLDAAHVAAEARRGSVELKFEVGGNELQVRVDVRQDDVQATFRTESPELRQALAREWDSVATAAAAAERGVRLLPAIFSAPSSHSDSGQGSAYAFAGGDASAGQRDARARRGESPRASGGSRAVGATGAGASAPAAPGPRVALPTSRHLHLFA